LRYLLASSLLVSCLAVGACSKSNGESSNPDVPAVTDASFQKEVIESDKPVLVDFWATWCGPCRMYGPIVDKMAEEYKGRLKVVRVDVDQNPNLSRNYRIQAIPASFIMQKGNVVKAWVGLVTEDDVKQQIEQVLSSGSAAPSHF
ncbi:MAG TPA: thioredoxin, partial [bacterium]|nr:thioredoxin [bacterium]